MSNLLPTVSGCCLSEFPSPHRCPLKQRRVHICKLLGLKYVIIGNKVIMGNNENLMETAYVLMGTNELIITHFRHL